MILSLNDCADTASMAVSAPNYVLEESISSQKLWRHTAGNVSLFIRLSYLLLKHIND